MTWNTSSRGTESRNVGSRSFSLFLSLLWLFSASLLWPQSQPSPQSQQTPPLTQYSKMTQAELLTVIDQRDNRLGQWLAQGRKWQADRAQFQTDLENLRLTVDKQTSTVQDLTNSLQTQKQTSDNQLASRDKMIDDQAIVISERTKERDAALAEVSRQKVMGWLEKLLYGLGGAGAGYAVGHLTK